jgi:hypothetical protein
MTSTYTHLIGIDRESGLLWGAVEISDGIDALRADIVANLSSAGIQESDEDGNPVPVTGEMLADRCTVYRVVLGDHEDEAPDLMPTNAQLVYSGWQMGWLPNDAFSAWGEEA